MPGTGSASPESPVELEPVYHFPLNDTVKSFDIGVFLRCSNMSELLISFCCSKVLFDAVSDKLGAIIISNGYSFNSILLIDSSESVNYVFLPDAFLKDLINRSPGEYIQNG